VFVRSSRWQTLLLPVRRVEETEEVEEEDEVDSRIEVEGVEDEEDSLIVEEEDEVEDSEEGVEGDLTEDSEIEEVEVEEGDEGELPFFWLGLKRECEETRTLTLELSPSFVFAETLPGLEGSPSSLELRRASLSDYLDGTA